MNSEAAWFKFYGSIPHSLDYPDISMCEMVFCSEREHPDFTAYDFMGNSSTYKKLKEDIEAAARARRSSPSHIK